MELALIYVAFSRAILLASLYIIGKFIKPKTQDKAKHLPSLEMKRLRESSMLVPKFAFLRDIPDGVMQMVSHNVQSIGKHIGTIRNDRVFMKSGVLLLQEVWDTSNKQFKVEGIQEIQRNDFEKEARGRGTMIFSSVVGISNASQFSFEWSKQRIDITACTVNNITIINVYKNPDATIDFLTTSLKTGALQRLLEAENLLLCGDFNENLADARNRLCNTLNLQFGIKLLSGIFPTTDANSTLDAVFGKLKNFEVEVFAYESFSSFHKPLVIRVKEN
jgi:hypothetical protein